jgi:2-oxopent-4-enoate/cis-2-oxohex-4-enoate hydratase
MDAKLIETLGDELFQAMSTQTVVEPLTSRHPNITIEHAYNIQQRMLSNRLQAGERIVGKKIGVTSAAVMNMLGVYQPDFGYLLDGMVYNEGQSIDSKTLIQPKAEGEIAFILKKDLMRLRGGPASRGPFHLRHGAGEKRRNHRHRRRRCRPGLAGERRGLAG